MQTALKVHRKTCPGDPPGNLASFDCSYTMSKRLETFVSSSVTDQAMLGATFFGFVAHLRREPSEWDRDWTGFGYRVGSRYGQNFAKGLTMFTAGSIMRSDPRHVTYANDPGSKCPCTGVWHRVNHAFLDWYSIRHSSPDGDGHRWPNVPMFAGAAASGFVGNAWYPDRLATPQQAGIRAANSLATALASSFYAEFQPEVSRLLGSIFKRRAKPMPTPVAPTPVVQPRAEIR